MDTVEEGLEEEKKEPSEVEKNAETDSSVNKFEAGSAYVSQKDYIPTPYKPSAWEGIEKYDVNASFLGISLDVIASDQFRIDPMFEIFEGTLEVPSFQQFKSEKLGIDEAPVEIPEEVLEEVRSAGYQEGLSEGMRQAEEQYTAQLAEIQEQYNQKLSELQTLICSAINEKAENIEKRALELSMAVSKKILDTTVDVRPDYIFEIIKKALYSVPGAKAVTVKLSPEDYEFINIEGLPADIAELPIEVSYQSDETIVSGCVIESEFGTINLEIDSMWNEIRQNLFSVVKE